MAKSQTLDEKIYLMRYYTKNFFFEVWDFAIYLHLIENFYKLVY